MYEYYYDNSEQRIYNEAAEHAKTCTNEQLENILWNYSMCDRLDWFDHLRKNAYEHEKRVRGC